MRNLLILSYCWFVCVTLQADDLTSLYQYFHAHPELSFQEEDTAARVAQELQQAGFEVTKNVGGHGVVGLLKNGKGPTLMLRTDMDALPVAEQTGLAYASRAQAISEGGESVAVMHACGHDTHMTIMIGVARELAATRDQWQGTLMIIAQPAEELGAGARAMLADGLFTRFPRPDFNLALHSMATLPAGTIGYTSGWALANVDSVDIIVHGVGGHGAYPHTTKDPVLLASSIVVSLQSLVAREIAPIEPAVVTVGSIQGGTKHNIIPDRVELQLTVRSYSDKVRDKLLGGIERIALNQARAYGFPEPQLPEVLIDRDRGTPAMWNDPLLVTRLLPTLKAAVGEQQVVVVTPEMGGEDFSRYGRQQPPIPSVMLRLGTVAVSDYNAYRRGEIELPSLHSPFYHPDLAPTLQTGIKAMSAAALDLLSPP